MNFLTPNPIRLHIRPFDIQQARLEAMMYGEVENANPFALAGLDTPMLKIQPADIQRRNLAQTLYSSSNKPGPYFYPGIGDAPPAGSYLQDQGGVFYTAHPPCAAFSPNWPTAQTLLEILAADPLKDQGSTWTGGPPLARGFRALNYTPQMIACVLEILPSWQQAKVDYLTWVSMGSPMGTPGTFTEPTYGQSNQTLQNQQIINAALTGQLSTAFQNPTATVPSYIQTEMSQVIPAGSTPAAAGAGAPAGSLPAGSSSFDLSQIPTWAWLAAAGVGAFLLMGKGKS